MESWDYLSDSVDPWLSFLYISVGSTGILPRDARWLSFLLSHGSGLELGPREGKVTTSRSSSTSSLWEIGLCLLLLNEVFKKKERPWRFPRPTDTKKRQDLSGAVQGIVGNLLLQGLESPTSISCRYFCWCSILSSCYRRLKPTLTRRWKQDNQECSRPTVGKIDNRRPSSLL